MWELSALIFSVNIERYVSTIEIYLCFCCLWNLFCAAKSMLLSDYMSFLHLRFNTAHPLCVESLEESSVVMDW
jgi:hypothetical protein